MTNKKILYISSFLPANIPYAGNITSFHIINHLSKKFKIDAIIYYNEIESKYLHGFLSHANMLNVNIIFLKKISFLTRFIKLIQYFYLPIFYSSRFDFLHSLSFVSAKSKYSFIYNEWSQTTLYSLVLSYFSKTKLIISTQDVISQNLDRKVKYEKNLILKAFYFFEYIKTRFYEPRFLNLSSSILVQCTKDKKLLIDLGVNGTDKIQVISPYINNLMNFNNSIVKNEFNIIFWGSVNRRENVEAVLHYYKNIHPSITNSIPNYKFYIVGANPSADIQALTSSNIIVTGFVSNPSDIFNKAHVSVVPLLTGAGIKVKTLESLLMGIPTVSTEIGSEGIHIDKSNGLFTVYNDDQFIENIITINDMYSHDLVDKTKIRKHFLHYYDFNSSLSTITSLLD